MDVSAKPRVLFVDDEVQVLESMAVNLRRRFTVATATSGAAALAQLAEGPAPSAIISDMKMPGMDGATFLAAARTVVPDAMRVLLTGKADITSAIAAINDGQIFRFLTKPCALPALITTLDAAVTQHRLITAERVLLEETVHGCVKTLTEVLALTNPVAFGRATRIKHRVAEIATALALRERWQIEVAAMLSQLGAIALPAATAEKLYFGKPLSAEEQAMVARVPAVTEQLLGNIPRLEEVRGILAAYQRAARIETDPMRAKIEYGAAILRAALDFDTLVAQGSSSEVAIAALRSRGERHDAGVLGALAAMHGGGRPVEIVEVRVASLRVGMVLADDVKRTDGLLILAHGVEITASFIAHMKNYPHGTVREPMRVIVRPERGATATL